jgi:UDP-N-acetylmuramoyl-L-alanyl-D-glutamate--2,6-diaminopimelate ligase
MKSFIKKILPSFLFDYYHKAMPFLGALIYGFPSKKIKVIGVTGTNGKTTTVNMISAVLEEAGYQTAFLSSIKFQIKKEEKPNLFKMTMPGRLEIQKFLKQAVDAGCEYVILEVSSEGLKQSRHLFVDFETAVFTNLSPEHIESHKGFDNYKKAKGLLFKKTSKTHIINTDDKHQEYFTSFDSQKKWGYGLKDNDSFKGQKVKAFNVLNNSDGIVFQVENETFNLKLLGDFNVYNALAAICVGLSYGVSLETSKKALESFKTVPGRMEQVISDPFNVIVDYAVTPDALEKLYQTIKKAFPQGKIIAVLGSCGGGRDKWKRPILGQIASEYCSRVFVTNEDPYDEDPMEIIEQVAEKAGDKAVKILDRREAIRKALQSAEKNDTVVVTGKGCEPWMCVAGGKKIPWDDCETIKQEIEKI